MSQAQTVKQQHCCRKSARWRPGELI